MLTNALFRTTDLLHGKSTLALPGAILMSAVVMIAHKHMTEGFDGQDNLRNFLFLIILQMLPLLLVEAKICRCEDPVDLLCKFGPKVLLMHVSFLLLRVGTYPFVGIGSGTYNIIGLFAALAALHFGFKFRWSLQSLWGNRDVFCLAFLAVAAAFMTVDFQMLFNEYASSNMKSLVLSQAVSTASDFVEVVAFVPAVWTLYRSQKVFDPLQVTKSSTRIGTGSLFAFVTAFYLTEDVGNAYEIYSVFPICTAAHMAHFFLVLDFAGFMLGHVYDPKKLKNNIVHWFPEANCF